MFTGMTGHNCYRVINHSLIRCEACCTGWHLVSGTGILVKSPWLDFIKWSNCQVAWHTYVLTPKPGIVSSSVRAASLCRNSNQCRDEYLVKVLRIRYRVLSLEQDIYNNPTIQVQGTLQERRWRELKAGESAAECCLRSVAALNSQLWLPHKNCTRSRQHNSSTEGVHDL